MVVPTATLSSFVPQMFEGSDTMRLTIVRAVVMAALVAVWLPNAHAGQLLIYPVSKLAGRLFGGAFLGGPDESGLMKHAWALGPAAIALNALIPFPVTLAAALVCRRSESLVRVWDGVAMAAGTLALIGGAASGLLLFVGIISSGYPSDLLRHFDLNCGALPALLCGSVSIATSYRLMRGQS